MADNTKQPPTPKLPSKATQEIGQSGTYNFQGYISAEEYNINLQGKYALQQFDIMRRSDPVVHAALIVCKNPIIGAKWNIEPASSDPKDVKIAALVSRELFDNKIMWQDTVRESLTTLDYGHYVAEIVYGITEFEGQKYVGLTKIASRKQRSILRWQISGERPGITQILPTGENVEIPRQKLLYVVNEQEGENYEGISLLRYAYKPWKIKDALEIMNAVALERLGIGVPVITKGANGETIDEAELKALRKSLQLMRANESAYLEIPSSVTLAMLNMQSHTTTDILPTIEHLESQIMLSVLAQFLLLGKGGNSGSRAVSADHSALFVKSLEAVARTIQMAFQRDIVNRLVDLNFSNLQNGYPKLVFSELSDDDASLTATAVASLMTAGALSRDADLENRLRDILDLPQLSEEDYDNYGKDDQPAPTVTKDASTPKDTTVPTDVQDTADEESVTASLIDDAKRMQQKIIAHIFES
jgi:phage gp29-like protein